MPRWPDLRRLDRPAARRGLEALDAWPRTRVPGAKADFRSAGRSAASDLVPDPDRRSSDVGPGPDVASMDQRGDPQRKAGVARRSQTVQGWPARYLECAATARSNEQPAGVRRQSMTQNTQVSSFWPGCSIRCSCSAVDYRWYAPVNGATTWNGGPPGIRTLNLRIKSPSPSRPRPSTTVQNDRIHG